jgi:hypothetical protein
VRQPQRTLAVRQAKQRWELEQKKAGGSRVGITCRHHVAPPFMQEGLAAFSRCYIHLHLKRETRFSLLLLLLLLLLLDTHIPSRGSSQSRRRFRAVKAAQVLKELPYARTSRKSVKISYGCGQKKKNMAVSALESPALQ